MSGEALMLVERRVLLLLLQLLPLVDAGKRVEGRMIISLFSVAV